MPKRAESFAASKHDGACYHVGTPEDLAEANALLASGQGWKVA